MQLGQVIGGKYRLLRLLGDGGMGAVYEAHHEVLGARVAIKVLHEDLAKKPELVDRFLREARVLAQIHSPFVVRVLDIAMAEEGRSAYIVMELLAGESLSALVAREKRLPLPVAIDFAEQMLEALAAAHALGIVHRDLKPENVLVTRDGERTVLKVIDFGIAKAGGLNGAAANLTVSGALMGTPEYMAPEQAHSADRADARSDIFSVGVMLYEMLAGARPVDGEDPRVVAMKVERGDVIPLIHRAPETPRDLAGLIHRAMAPRPELRFASAVEMRQALDAAMANHRVAGQPARISHPSVRPPIVAPSPGAPSLVQPPDPGRGTGTMFGAPAALNASPTTAPRPAGATDHGSYAPSPAMQGGPGAWTPPPAYGSPAAAPQPAAARGRGRGAGGTMWAVVGLGVVLACGVALAFAFGGSSSGGAKASPSSTPTPIASADPPASGSPASPATPPADDPLGPLPSTGPAPHAVVTPAHPAPNPSGAPSSGPSGTPSAPATGGLDTPFGIPPFNLPSIPNPFPSPGGSGVGPVMTIPTSFPPFGFPPAPGQPAAPSAAPSAAPAPHRPNH